MSNLDNNVNINNAGRTYSRGVKKEDIKPQAKYAETEPEVVLNDGTKAADAYGRILVKSGKVDSADMTKAVQEAIDFYVNHPELAKAAVNTGDHVYELLEATGNKNAYEESCCGACDAAYARLN